MTKPSVIRSAAGVLGLLSGLFSAWHAYGALRIDAPMGTVGLLTCVALLQIAASVQFALRLGRGGDGMFLFIFGAASIANVDRFLWTPLTSLLVTPAAFVVGLAAYYFDRRKAATMGAQEEQR